MKKKKNRPKSKTEKKQQKTTTGINRIAVSDGFRTTEIETSESLDDALAMLQIVQNNCFFNETKCRTRPRYIG